MNPFADHRAIMRSNFPELDRIQSDQKLGRPQPPLAKAVFRAAITRRLGVASLVATLVVASLFVNGCGTDQPAGPSDSCSSLAISPASSSVASAGAEGTITVTAGPGCSWQAQASAAWVQLLSGTSGVGNGSVGYAVATNPSGAARQAGITVNTRTLGITQEGSAQGCTFQVTPTARVVPARATGFAVRVMAPFGCRWTFAGNGSWLRVIPDSDGAPNGNGNGTVEAEVLENTGDASRTATATVAGQAITVRQDGTRVAACSFTLTPASVDVPASGGTGQVAVSTTDACAWNALIGGPDYSVVTVTGNQSGLGSGVVSFLVAPNPGAASRRGSLVVQGSTGAGEGILTVNQAGR